MAAQVDSDVAVIGAGPAGLAVARALRRRGIDYTQVERHTGVGGLWDIDNPGSALYESAHFISSRTLSAFSGFPMPQDYPDYPGHRQILRYLRDFAEHEDLTGAIRFGVGVTDVEKLPGGTWGLRHDDGATTRHRHVVVCSGSQWEPLVPELPGTFTGEVRHSRTYTSPAELAGRRVLVVGGGNSACDIACDAARSADSAVISMRRGYWFIPKHIFGMPSDVFAENGPTLPMWLEQRVFGAMLRLLNGDPRRLGLQQPDHRLFETHPVLNSQLLHHLQHGDITARPGIADTDGSTVTFTDGTSGTFDLILLATGYRHSVPSAQRWFGDPQHPDLYLTAFSRQHTGLFGVGFVETNSGAYPIFDLLAHLVASHIADRDADPARWRRFEHRLRHDRPDLTGGIALDDSPRHTGYVDSPTIRRHLARVAVETGWGAP